jgi:tetratricopeptide (TPR) repeat protein
MTSSKPKSKWSVSAVLAATLILALAGTGCQSGKKKQTANQQSEKRWAATRAAVLATLAKGQLESGQFDKARESIDKAKRLDPSNAQICLLAAKLELEEGRLDVAERELAEARRLDPKNAEADYLSGVVYQRWLKPKVAFDYYSSAAEKNPREVAYPLAAAEMLVDLGRSEEALSMLQGRLDEFGTSAVMHDTIGQLYVAQGQYAQAVDALRQASTLASDDNQVREHLAMAMFYNGQYREAADAFARVLKDPANASRAELHIAMGECQMNLRRPRDARDSFERATHLSPASATAFLSLTKAALELNDLRRAEVALRKAVALAPEQAETHLMLGFVRLKQERLPDALLAFRKASSLDANDPVALCMVGYVLEKSGRTQQAVQYYGRALRIDPDDELATKLMASVND